MAEQPQKNMLLLSGSKAAGNLPNSDDVKPGMLDWAEPWIKEFFAKAVQEKKPVLFVPYARPGGKTEDVYFAEIKKRLEKMGIETICAPETGITPQLLESTGGIFVGGGHTPTLLHKLQQTNSVAAIRDAVNKGLPYLGSSAGTLIACPTIKTNNDMPGPANDVIDLRSLGLVNAQINCHYMDDSMHDPKHQGEKRDERLKEYCTFNPNRAVLGLYEGQALRVTGDKVMLWTSEQTRGAKPEHELKSGEERITRTPIFINEERREIECRVGEEKDVSRTFEGPGKGWANTVT